MIARALLLIGLTALLGLSSPEALAAAPAASLPPPSGYVPGEATLEGRLLAPCCWNQTLDIHDSEIARQLRDEIRSRLLAGERADAIEADLVGRYGERLRAVPQGKSLSGMGLWLSIVFAVAGLGAGAVVYRWARKGRAASADLPPAGPIPAGPKDRWDEQLDEQLREQED